MKLILPQRARLPADVLYAEFVAPIFFICSGSRVPTSGSGGT